MEPELRESDGEALRQLVADCLDRLEVEGESAVEELCREHPEHESELRRRIHGLRAVGLLEPRANAAEEEIPERLGEFRLLRRLGGGGMGVVYLARQEPLGREVALKLIRPEQLFFPGARERFRREIETIARLQHPGIVPVHTVGEEKGIPYFAMERVRGCTLADAIDALRDRDPDTLGGSDLARAIVLCTPEADDSVAALGTSWAFTGSYVDACLHLIRQAAEALEHAHRRGILHRDIKPSNLMVTPAGRLMILDFGLASSGGATKLTRTGAQIGSLAYMSPEQLEGDLDRLDARADVWALGVTLHELLALRSPFASESPEETRRAILAGHLPSLRARQRAVSWDAETVCKKAMESEPSRRYASAADLARDLENVLEHRPIEARRAGAWLRARRWSQRHPARAVAIALTSLVAVGGPVVYGLQQARAREAIQAALDEAETERAAATAARERAEKNFGRALQAVQTMLTHLGEKRLENVPQVQTVRREILEDALGFYREFLTEKGDDPWLLEELARVQDQIAELSEMLGYAEDALEAHLARNETRLALLEASPEDVHLRHLYANGLVNMALFVQAQGKSEESEKLFGEALERLEELLEGDPSNPGYLRERAVVFSSLGEMLRTRRQMPESEAFLRWALEDLATVAATGVADADDRVGEAWVWNELGQGHGDEGRYEEAWEEHRQALSIRERLVEEDPQSTHHVASLGHSRVNMGALAWSMGRDAEAIELLSDAVTTFQALTGDYPDVPLYSNLLSVSASWLSVALGGPEQLEESRRYGKIAFDVAQRLHESYPETPVYTMNYGAAILAVAKNLANRGSWSEALVRVGEARAVLDALLARHPGDARCLFQIATAKQQQAQALFELGHDEEALALVAELLPGPIAHEIRYFREILIQLGACASRAENDGSLLPADREARISTCAELAAANLARLRDRGFAAWEEVWAQPELEPLRQREEIPEEYRPGAGGEG